jgi:rhodanese-related sulfurtransferase
MTRIHTALAIVAATLGLTAAGADSGAGADVATLASEIGAERDHISAPDLADRIMRKDQSLQILDLRPQSEYEQLHIPTATVADVDTLGSLRLPRNASIVLYSEGATHAAQGWMLLRLRGYRDVRFLREGIYEWLARVMEPRLAEDATPEERADFERAEKQSRFFGGQPRASVPRTEVPIGYWSVSSHATGASTIGKSPSAAEAIRATVGNIRRRGC